MVLTRSRFETPVGPMQALATDRALCALEFSRAGRLSRLDARLARWFGTPDIVEGSNHVIDAVRTWLDEYFAGRSADASGVRLDMRGAPFEGLVWTALLKIPPGTTTSYGAIANAIGSPGAARAVGMANGANPIAIIVPCHRVIGSNGALTGYGGGLDRKTWLLAHERRWSPEPGLPLTPG
jgi:methylated-DNA-[protein]-cysteine S-methyltransferase